MGLIQKLNLWERWLKNKSKISEEKTAYNIGFSKPKTTARRLTSANKFKHLNIQLLARCFSAKWIILIAWLRDKMIITKLLKLFRFVHFYVWNKQRLVIPTKEESQTYRLLDSSFVGMTKTINFQKFKQFKWDSYHQPYRE